ncbi:hypothetical protein [Actinoplanes sp. L3-i22]|uniref:hypothetical protein n=1 Tax=Actinoplanes sp. L3-i22 TaxID=2836373 RepID=UPI001C77F5BB|nr:hypothetical protein [Actinoplanes sp. L3-i22]BCY08478.1 hypothetical protein L3i22_035660 [Actinoplanes sp. L3-i22]
MNNAKQYFKEFAALSVFALGAVIAMAASGHTVNTFMWVRGFLLPAVAVTLYVMTRAGAVDRVRTVTVIMPIAIVGVDLIPGVCPIWYTIAQAVCMIPVVAAAVTLRRSATPKTI